MIGAGFVFKVKGNKDYLKMLQSKGNERFELTWEKYFTELKVSGGSASN